MQDQIEALKESTPAVHTEVQRISRRDPPSQWRAQIEAGCSVLRDARKSKTCTLPHQSPVVDEPPWHVLLSDVVCSAEQSIIGEIEEATHVALHRSIVDYLDRVCLELGSALQNLVHNKM